MRDALSLAALSACLCTLAWAMITQPEPPTNHAALEQCMRLHPERFCRLNHAPSTVAP